MPGMHSNKRGRKKSCLGWFCSLLQWSALCVVSFCAYKAYTELKDTTLQLSMLSDEYSALRETYSATETELRKAGDIFNMVKNKMKSIYPESLLNEQGVEGRKQLFDSMMKRQDAQTSRINNLQRSIQEFNRKELEEKYGPGPYKIEVTLSLDGERKFFSIETAPNKLMPHSVKKFMDLVELNTFDNTPMVATGHIILTSLPDEIAKDDSKQLSFPEYSSEFPHVKNTVGFATRPGGPEIYINLDDNSKIHGPGGQSHHPILEEADACFGKIIRGFDLMPQIRQGKKATIVKMTLLKNKR